MRRRKRVVLSGSYFRIFQILVYLRFLPLLLGVVLAVYLIFFSPLFLIRDTEILFEGRGFDSEGIGNLLRSEAGGKNIFLLNDGKLSERLKKTYLSVLAVRPTRRLPAKVVFYIKQREPLASLLPVSEGMASPSALLTLVRESSRSGEKTLIDEEGYLFFRGEFAALPSLVVKNVTELDRFLGDSISKFMVDLIDKSVEGGISVSVVSPHYGDVLLLLSEGGIVWLSPEKEGGSQVELLKMIIEKYRIEGKKIAKIDLRFKNPVVEFK